MQGVFVKEMTFPNSCRECPFVHFSDGEMICSAINSFWSKSSNKVGDAICYYERLDNCPLREVEIPD